MRRFLPLGLLALFWLAGCGTMPVDSESTREVVLQYLGGDVGTAGPYGRGGKKELDILSPADRKAAMDLIDDGAVLFVVFGTNPADPAAPAHPTRIVMVHRGKVVADYRAVAPAAPAPATP